MPLDFHNSPQRYDQPHMSLENILKSPRSLDEDSVSVWWDMQINII